MHYSKLILQSSIFFLIFSLLSCSYNGPQQKIDLPLAEQNVDASSVVLFKDVQPILEAQCARCHLEGKSGAMKINWVDFTSAKIYVENGKLKARVTGGSMPPKTNRGSFSDSDAKIILAWVASGGLKVPPVSGTTPNVDNGEDPNLPPVIAEDITNLRLVQTCTACHGTFGINEGFPYLAGLTPEYILTQLKSFSGRYADIPQREEAGTMIDQVSELTEENFEYLSDYFGHISYSSKTAKENLFDLDEDDLIIYEQGKSVVKEAACLSCHNDSLTPKITGQNDIYIETSLYAFAEGERKNDSMEAVLKSDAISEDDYEAVSMYLSQLINVKQQTFNELAPEDIKVSFTKNCATCHTSSNLDSRIPILSGLKSRYIKTEFKNFAAKKRSDTVTHHMGKVANLLSKEQISLFAEYIDDDLACASESSAATALKKEADDTSATTDPTDTVTAHALLTPEQLEINKGELVFKDRKNRCATCHNPKGTSIGPQIHGQREGYLVHSLMDFKARRRKGSSMSGVARKLSEEDINAVSKYLSSLNRCQ